MLTQGGKSDILLLYTLAMTDKDKTSFLLLYLFFIFMFWHQFQNLPAGILAGTWAISLHEFMFPFGSIEKTVEIGEFVNRPAEGWR